MAADLILRNARVLTMDGALPYAEAVATAGDRIVAVGDDGAVEASRGPATRVIDCRRLPLVPGFIDAHLHLLAYAASLLSVDCSPAAVSSIPELQEAIARRAAVTPPGGWVRATGYDESKLAEGRHPDRHDLDRAAPVHPVRLLHRSGHACVLNSAALALAGIDIATEEPPGGHLERDLETGEPTGLLLEMNEVVERAVPPLPSSELDAAVAEAGRRLLARGITAIEDATATNGRDEWALMERLMAGGRLPQSVTLMEGFGRRGTLPEESPTVPLRRGAVKIAVSEIGEELAPDGESLAQMVWEVHAAGRQVAVHAVEERTVAAAVAAIEAALARRPRRDHRHRVEHCGVCPPALARRLAAAGAVAVSNPAFVYYQGDRYRRQLSPADLRHAYDARSLRTAGVVVAAGSDAPVVPPGSAAAIAGAARRTAAGDRLPGRPLAPLEALALHTRDAAFASFQEGERGTLRPGLRADLALLSSDPESAARGEVDTLEVEMTVLGGKAAWTREGWPG